MHPLAKLLQKLLNERRCRVSELTPSLRRALQPLLDSGVLVEVRAGAGRRVEVRRPESLAAFAAQQFPGGLDIGLPANRASAVAGYRDSKQARPEAPPVLLWRGAPGTTLAGETTVLDVGNLTAWFGAAVLAPADLDQWRLVEAIAIIENREAFFAAERLARWGLSPRLFLLGAGRLDQRVRHWLARQPVTIWHCPDYDAVGLSEYLTLKAAGADVRLFIPPQFEQLLMQYGKPALAVMTPELRDLLDTTQDGIAMALAECLAQQGVGLEQEVLLL